MWGWAWRGCPAPRAIVLTTELKLCELTIEHEDVVLTSFSFTPSAALGDGDSETSPREPGGWCAEALQSREGPRAGGESLPLSQVAPLGRLLWGPFSI